MVVNFFEKISTPFFERGIFSEWEWKCRHCGNTFTTESQNKKPAFCECRHREFELPCLRKIPKPPLEERPELLEILKNPLPAVLKELQCWVAGEEQALKTIFLLTCLGKVKNANPTSSNLLVNSVSGAGKDFVVAAVLSLWDCNYALTRSRISPTALNYWHQNEDEWTWNDKILFLADISNAVFNADCFKAMASGQNAVTITERGKAVDIAIRGKPVLLLTSAFPNPSQELLRRFPILSLTETAAQTKKILSFHGIREATAKKRKPNQKLRLALDYLEEFPVIVPYADAIASLFSDSLPARTYYTRLIDYVKASAVLHQQVRQKKQEGEEIFLVAEQQDYELGAACFLSTALTSTLMPLTGQQRQLAQFFSEENQVSFNFAELREREAFAAIPERTLRRQLEKLVSMGIIKAHTDRVEESIRPVQFFSFKAFNAITLPTWQDIQITWQNRQNGTTTNDMAEQADLAERVESPKQPVLPKEEKQEILNREKTVVLTQSAQSAQSATVNALSLNILGHVKEES